MARRLRTALLEHCVPATLALFLATNLVPQSILVHHHPGGELPHVHAFGEFFGPEHYHLHPRVVSTDGRPAIGVPADFDCHVHCQQPYQTAAKVAVSALAPVMVPVRVEASTVGTLPPAPLPTACIRGPPILSPVVSDQID